MVKWIYLLLFISVNTSLADISQEVFTSPILGKWKFTEYIYEGKSLPLPNPHLNLFLNSTKREAIACGGTAIMKTAFVNALAYTNMRMKF